MVATVSMVVTVTLEGVRVVVGERVAAGEVMVVLTVVWMTFGTVVVELTSGVLVEVRETVGV